MQVTGLVTCDQVITCKNQVESTIQAIQVNIELQHQSRPITPSNSGKQSKIIFQTIHRHNYNNNRLSN